MAWPTSVREQLVGAGKTSSRWPTGARVDVAGLPIDRETAEGSVTRTITGVSTRVPVRSVNRAPGRSCSRRGCSLPAHGLGEPAGSRLAAPVGLPDPHPTPLHAPRGAPLTPTAAVLWAGSGSVGPPPGHFLARGGLRDPFPGHFLARRWAPWGPPGTIRCPGGGSGSPSTLGNRGPARPETPRDSTQRGSLGRRPGCSNGDVV